MEVDLLNKLAPAVERQDTNRPTLSNCLTQLARLGGYLVRASDPPPCNIVIWRGMARLTDVELGFTLVAGNYG